MKNKCYKKLLERKYKLDKVYNENIDRLVESTAQVKGLFMEQMQELIDQFTELEYEILVEGKPLDKAILREMKHSVDEMSALVLHLEEGCL